MRSFSNRSISQLDQEQNNNKYDDSIEVENSDMNDDSEQIDYEDLFEEVRRQEILRNINEQQEESVENNDVAEVLDKRAKRQQKRQQYNKKQQMKRLRQQNALLFFRKIKMQLLINFKESIMKATQVYLIYEQKISQVLSVCSLQTVKIFQTLQSTLVNLRRRQCFQQLLLRIFQQDKIQLKGLAKYQFILCLALMIKVNIRKLCFIDISQMELQSFYNLKYLAGKNKKKTINKQLDILKNKLQRRATQEQLKDKNFISIDAYHYNPKAHLQSKPISQSSNSAQILNSRSWSSKFDGIQEMKKTYLDSFCQIYCPIQENWQIFSMETLENVQLDMMKNSILQNKAIIGFYSTRILEFKQKFKYLAVQRMAGNVQIIDQTYQFCDKYELVEKRRNRLGCKSLYRNFMRQANIFRNLEIFYETDQILIQKQRKRELDWALNNFPKSVREMKLSDYFVTPSLVEKYMIIKQGAQPIPNTQFHEQKVYYKSDLQRVSSRMGWVDCGRMVKDNQIPIKTTENKNKTTTKLYKFNQTEIFKIRLDENGDLLLDQDYNSIYVPPHFDIPIGYQLVPDNVQYLCKKNKFKCARIVQGFDVAGSHIVPNNIGFLVQAKHRVEIEKIFLERQEKLRIKKQERKIEGAMGLWRKLFKSIIISQQVHSR